MVEIEGLKYKGKPVENMGSVTGLKDNKCPEPRCNRTLERYLIRHTFDTMCTVVACPTHPHKAWEDVFPKGSLKYTKDYTNADKRFPLC